MFADTRGNELQNSLQNKYGRLGLKAPIARSWKNLLGLVAAMEHIPKVAPLKPYGMLIGMAFLSKIGESWSKEQFGRRERKIHGEIT